MIDPAALARLSLFADLDRAGLAAVAERADEASFPRGARVLRQGISGNSFFVITDGEAAVVVDGTDRSRLHAGDFFGELSILTGEAVIADVVVVSEELRCAVLPPGELRPLLLEYPHVALRMLEVGARRLRATTLWAG
jgi:CRP-like cAMP-binding protein